MNAQKLPGEVVQVARDIQTWAVTDHDWTGEWTNEGEILADHQSHGPYIRIRVEVTGGFANGFISSPRLEQDIPIMGGLMITGPVKNDIWDAEVQDYVGGRHYVFAKLRIERKDKLLLLTTVEQPPDWFPVRTKLWRTSPTP